MTCRLLLAATLSLLFVLPGFAQDADKDKAERSRLSEDVDRSANSREQDDQYPLTLKEVSVSRHMILPHKPGGKYYITGTTDLKNVWKGPTQGFHVFSSKDLAAWQKHLAWTPPEGSEWNQKAWGAVIVPWRNKFVMLGAVYSAKRKRHCVLSMISDSPEGPYKLQSSQPVMEGIDPAYVLDEKGKPWLVVGGLKATLAAPLSDDLTEVTAKPVKILHASEVPGAEPRKGKKGKWYHDAPAFHRLENGDLLMFFSADYKYPDGMDYATFKLRSSTGKITGPWLSEGVLLDRQHGVWIWRRLDGQLMLTAKPRGVSIEKGYPDLQPMLESKTDISASPGKQKRTGCINSQAK